MILACGYRGEIGGNQDLLWHLPIDMKHFGRTTRGCNVVMGSNTYMSLPETFPALPGRTNIVVTSRPEMVLKEYEKRCEKYSKKPPKLMCAESLDEAAEMCNDPIANEGRNDRDNYIIGGASLYDYALSNGYVDYISRTLVHESFLQADTIVWHTDFEKLGFEIKKIHHHSPDAENEYGMSIEWWEMKKETWDAKE